MNAKKKMRKRAVTNVAASCATMNIEMTTPAAGSGQDEMKSQQHRDFNEAMRKVLPSGYRLMRNGQHSDELQDDEIIEMMKQDKAYCQSHGGPKSIDKLAKLLKDEGANYSFSRGQVEAFLWSKFEQIMGLQNLSCQLCGKEIEGSNTEKYRELTNRYGAFHVGCAEELCRLDARKWQETSWGLRNGVDQ